MTSAPSFRLLPVEATEAMIATARRCDAAAEQMNRWLLTNGGPIDIGEVYDWRNNMLLAGLALRDAAKRVSAAPVTAEATDEMVDAACDAYWGTWQKLTGPVRDSMRTALNAALAIAAGQLGEKESGE